MPQPAPRWLPSVLSWAEPRTRLLGEQMAQLSQVIGHDAREDTPRVRGAWLSALGLGGGEHASEHDLIDVEEVGVGNIIAAWHANEVNRLLYVTSIGVAADARSSWARGRARIETLLFVSGLNVTVLRPG